MSCWDTGFCPKKSRSLEDIFVLTCTLTVSSLEKFVLIGLEDKDSRQNY